MQSLSLLCAQPLGLENAGDMSAGDLRSWAIPVGWEKNLGNSHESTGESESVGNDWWLLNEIFSNLPSGELTFCHGKLPFLMGKSTINGHFQLLYVSSPEGNEIFPFWGFRKGNSEEMMRVAAFGTGEKCCQPFFSVI